MTFLIFCSTTFSFFSFFPFLTLSSFPSFPSFPCLFVSSPACHLSKWLFRLGNFSGSSSFLAPHSAVKIVEVESKPDSLRNCPIAARSWGGAGEDCGGDGDGSVVFFEPLFFNLVPMLNYGIKYCTEQKAILGTGWAIVDKGCDGTI